jgi:ribonuclease BN (tRNA processing enzyme)
MRVMAPSIGPRLRLTVLGCSTAAPHPASPTAGYLVEWDTTAILLDVGQGVIRNLQRVLEPHELTAIVIGHMHADHYLDLVGLRYLYPWGERAPDPLAVHLPPGGRARVDALAMAVSERPGFFDAAFDAVEFDPDTSLRIGDLQVSFVQGRHYVPAWGVIVEAPDGTRLGYTGDTGPSESVTAAMRGVDLLLVESALSDLRFDDPERGHLMADEAIQLVADAHAAAGMLVHYAPARRAELEALCAAAPVPMRVALDGLTITVRAAAPLAAGAGVAPATGTVAAD